MSRHYGRQWIGEMVQARLFGLAQRFAQALVDLSTEGSPERTKLVIHCLITALLHYYIARLCYQAVWLHWRLFARFRKRFWTIALQKRRGLIHHQRSVLLCLVLQVLGSCCLMAQPMPEELHRAFVLSWLSGWRWSRRWPVEIVPRRRVRSYPNVTAVTQRHCCVGNNWNWSKQQSTSIATFALRCSGSTLWGNRSCVRFAI